MRIAIFNWCLIRITSPRYLGTYLSTHYLGTVGERGYLRTTYHRSLDEPRPPAAKLIERVNGESLLQRARTPAQEIATICRLRGSEQLSSLACTEAFKLSAIQLSGRRLLPTWNTVSVVQAITQFTADCTLRIAGCFERRNCNARA